MELKYGCRSEYGPLELRIQVGASANGFTVFVEDRRPASPVLLEHPAQTTLEAAKESAAAQADEYLKGRQEQTPYATEWRCS